MADISTKVKIDRNELGLWIKTVKLDYKFDDYAQLAVLVSEHSGFYCSEQDIIDYYEITDEDYELENRKHIYFLKTKVL